MNKICIIIIMAVVIKSILPIWSSLILSLSMGFNTNEMAVNNLCVSLNALY